MLPALAAWVKSSTRRTPSYEHHRLEALWMYQSLDVVEPKLLDTLLQREGLPRPGRGRAGAVALARRGCPTPSTC